MSDPAPLSRHDLQAKLRDCEAALALAESAHQDVERRLGEHKRALAAAGRASDLKGNVIAHAIALREAAWGYRHHVDPPSVAERLDEAGRAFDRAVEAAERCPTCLSDDWFFDQFGAGNDVHTAVHNSRPVELRCPDPFHTPPDHSKTVPVASESGPGARCPDPRCGGKRDSPQPVGRKPIYCDNSFHDQPVSESVEAERLPFAEAIQEVLEAGGLHWRVRNTLSEAPGQVARLEVQLDEFRKAAHSNAVIDVITDLADIRIALAAADHERDELRRRLGTKSEQHLDANQRAETAEAALSQAKAERDEARAEWRTANELAANGFKSGEHLLARAETAESSHDALLGQLRDAIEWAEGETARKHLLADKRESNAYRACADHLRNLLRNGDSGSEGE